jgi:anaerobic selenocysteine-containing dehydrogenase
VALRAVDPAIARDPVPDSARDLPTVCVLCSQNCGLRVDVADGKIAAVRPDPTNPITQGYVCNKAVTIPRYAHHAQRLTQPLRRNANGRFTPVSWDVAIAQIAHTLAELRARHGPRALALVGVGGQSNHLGAAHALGFLQGFGSRRWFNAYAQEKTQNHLVEAWMMQASPGVFLHADTARCAYLLVLGTNPRVSNRGHAARDTFKALVSNPSRRLVVVDPRDTESAHGADRHLRVRPGHDCDLLLAMLAHLVRRELYDAPFVQAHTRDAKVLFARLGALDPDALARRAGLDPEVVRDETERFARARGAAVLWDLGIEQGRFSTLNAYLLRLLVVLTGNLGAPGGMHFLEALNPPPQGRAKHPPERALVSGIAAIRALGDPAMFSPSLFPEEVLCDHPERVRAVLVDACNPLVSYADTPRWREAFARLELKVVLDPAMTETAWLADWVLPTPVGYEKWELCGFPNGWPEVRAQLRPPVLPAPEGPLPETEIYARLAEALGLFGSPPPGLGALARGALTPLGAEAYSATLVGYATTAGAVWGNGTQNRALYWAYRTLGPRLPAPGLVVPWLLCLQNAYARREAVLRALGPEHRRARPAALALALYQRLLAHPEGCTVAVLDDDPGAHLRENVTFPEHKIHLAPVEMLAELDRCLAAPEETSAQFPWVLAAGLRTRWTANTIQRDPAWRKGKGPHGALSLHPEDARDLGVRSGDRVRLVTAGGSAIVEALEDPRGPRGFVAVPNGLGLGYARAELQPSTLDGLNANELTRAADRDPFTGCPQHKHVPCRVDALRPSLAPPEPPSTPEHGGTSVPER